MVIVNIRELTHNLSKYLKDVQAGERIIITQRNVPVADIVPHNENVAKPGWKRSLKKISLHGETLSETVLRNRTEEAR